MIHLGLQTEFSFKQSFLHMKDIHKYVVDGCVGIADAHNTFGHVQLEKMSKKYGFKPIYGVRLFVLPDESKQRSASLTWMFLAKNEAGLKEIYEYVAKAYNNFYYIPRLNYSDIKLTGNTIIIAPVENPISDYIAVGQGQVEYPLVTNLVAITTNNFPEIEDRAVYELLAGARKGNGDELVYSFNTETYPQHIMNEEEWMSEYGCSIAVHNTKEIADQIESFPLPKAGMVHWTGEHDLKKFMDFKKVKDWTEEYDLRLKRELELMPMANLLRYRAVS